MSKHDLHDQGENPMQEETLKGFTAEDFDIQTFSDLFHNDSTSEFEFETDLSCIYTPPADGVQLPVFEDRDDTPVIEETDLPEETIPESNLIENLFLTENAESQTESESRSNNQEHDNDCRKDDDVDDNDDDDDEDDEDEDDEEDEDEDEDDDDEHPGALRHFLHAVFNIILGFLTVFSLLYLIAVYSNNPVIVKTRNMYIQTAMATLNHKYLATAIFPSDMIEDLMRLQYESENAMLGKQSGWGAITIQSLPTFEQQTTELTGGRHEAEPVESSEVSASIEVTDENMGPEYESASEAIFFDLFYEVDFNSMHNYLDSHPEALDDGWANIDINEAGLNDEGTEILTVHGDKVLAINAQEGVILIEVNLGLSRGVMAIGKDTAKLRLCAASTIGVIGQTAGRICDANGGILSMTGNGFVDIDGGGNGGQISGVGICSGTVYGSPLWGYKRVEIREDDLMYIVDSYSEITSDVRDACEFTPALIIDGEIVVDENCGWTGPRARTALGQTSYKECVMLVVEGDTLNSPGSSVVPVAELMAKYGCVQAMNLDGGSSAIMYYDGEYVTRCANENLSGGRPMPTAWVYG